jgi:AAA15 family ATPase/GTPase
MLNRLTLENFRGFAKHSLSFSELTIIVGKNNAGKSTIKGVSTLKSNLKVLVESKLGVGIH